MLNCIKNLKSFWRFSVISVVFVLFAAVFLSSYFATPAHAAEVERVPIHFNTNGGTMPESALPYYYYANGVGTLYDAEENGAAVAVPLPTKEGKSFGGWADADAVNVFAADGSVLSAVDYASAEPTLVARWGDTITLQNENGISLGTSAVVVGDTSLEFVTPQKTGYVFDGWMVSGTTIVAPDGSFIDYEGYTTDNKWTRDSTATLTAKWVAAVYAITLDYADNATADGTVYAKYSDSIIYGTSSASIVGSLPTATREGYVFDGWYTTDGQLLSLGGSTSWGSVSAAGLFEQGKWIGTAPTTLVAHWVASTFDVALDINDGSHTIFGTVYAKYDSDCIFGDRTAVNYAREFVPTRLHYNFAGWYTDNNIKYADGYGENVTGVAEGEPGVPERWVTGQWTELSGATLYAKWIPHTYTITFDFGDGTATEKTLTYSDSGFSYGALPLLTDKVGYDNVGWAYAGDEISSETPVVNFSSHTLTAVRRLNSATATASGYVGVEDGESHLLTVSASHASGAALSYQWYKGNSLLLGANNNTLAVTQAVDSGTYYCCVTAFDGVQTASVTLSVGATIKAVAVSTTADSSIIGGIEYADGIAPTASFGIFTSQNQEITQPDGYRLQGVYTLSLLDGDAYVQPNGEVTVLLKLDGMKAANTKVVLFYNGKAVEKTLTQRDEYLTFTTDVFCDFAVVTKKFDLLWLAITAPIVGVAAIAVALFLIVKRRKKDSK